jgi:hypothetical protein
MRDYRLIILAACSFLVGPHPVLAWCQRISTLREEAASCDLVVYGHLEDTRGDTPEGSMKLVVSAVVSRNPAIVGRRVFTIPHRSVGEDAKKVSYLAFGEVAPGGPDFYRFVPATPATVRYLQGLMRLDGKDQSKVLRYCADYLQHRDPTIAHDAFTEFIRSQPEDICKAGQHMSAKALRGRVVDRATPPRLLGVYGLLLGSCGGDADAGALRAALDRVTKQAEPPAIDGLLIGYTLLKREEGWWYVRRLMSDPNAPFITRYACLRAARFFHATRPDVLMAADVVAVLEIGLDQPDLADLPIEDLRKWRCWQATDRILRLHGQKPYDIPIIKRCILRYALTCPHAAAEEFVSARRKVDPEAVEDAEEVLRLADELPPKK